MALDLSPTGGSTRYIKTVSGITIPQSAGSIVFRVYPTWAQTDGAAHSWFDIRNGGLGYYFTIEHWSDNTLYAGWSKTTPDYRVVVTSGNYTLNQNAWNTFILTWDGSGTTLYLNGTQIGTNGNAPPTWDTSARLLWMGQSDGLFHGDCNSRLSDVAIFSSVLGSTDRSSYNSGTCAKSLSVSPDAWWDFRIDKRPRSGSSYLQNAGAQKVSFAANPTVTWPTADVTTNCRGWYNLESSGVDSSPAGQDLTAINSPTYTTGKIGNAASLANASSQYFTRAYNASNDLTSKGTIVFFAKATSYADANGNYAFSIGESGGGNWNFLVRVSSTEARCFMGNNTNYYVRNTAISPGTGSWFQVIITVDLAATDAEDQMGMIVNGDATYDVPNGTTSLVSLTTQPNAVGYLANDGSGRSWDGLMDLVGLYIGRALAPWDTDGLWNSGSGVDPFASAASATGPFYFNLVAGLRA